MKTRNEYFPEIQTSKLIVIKIGSARVSGDVETIHDFLYTLVGDIRKLRDQGIEVILVSSGAIAQGKRTLSSKITNIEKPSLAEKQALAAIGQNKLLNLYESFFSRVNIAIAQILFGRKDLSQAESFLNLKQTFRTLLNWGIIPIVNENDSVSTEEINLGDNDILSAIVASIVGADLLLILTGVEGFLVGGEKIDLIHEFTENLEAYALGPSGPGTGGMFTKLKAAKHLTNFGIKTAILNGSKPGIVQEFFTNPNVGTLITKPEMTKSVPEVSSIQKQFFESEPL